MQLATWEDKFHCKTPALMTDGWDGTVLLLESQTICYSCGGVSLCRMTFVHKGTKNKDLLKLGMGASVRHISTSCTECKDVSVG